MQQSFRSVRHIKGFRPPRRREEQHAKRGVRETFQPRGSRRSKAPWPATEPAGLSKRTEQCHAMQYYAFSCTHHTTIRGQPATSPNPRSTVPTRHRSTHPAQRTGAPPPSNHRTPSTQGRKLIPPTDMPAGGAIAWPSPLPACAWLCHEVKDALVACVWSGLHQHISPFHTPLAPSLVGAGSRE